MHWSEEELQIPIVPGAVHSEGRREGEKVQPPPVFDLDFGRVSILSCFDINYPELWMHLSARGVDIVFWPSMYPAGGLLKSIARVFHLYIISSVRLEYAPPQLVDLVGRTIIPEILNKDNAVDDWLAYIVTLDLSKQLMHADMLHGWGQISDLKKNLEKYEVTHLDEAEQWFIQSRWSKQKCRLPNTVRNSTQVAVCGEGGLKDFIRRSRDDINSRRGIQPSKFSQSQHRKMSKEALEMDRTVLSPSEFIQVSMRGRRRHTAGDDAHTGLDDVSYLDEDELPDSDMPRSFEKQTQGNIHMVAINFADQSRLYEHDPVFLRMPIQPLPVDPKFITEHTGLKVPAQYDCSKAFDRRADRYPGSDPAWGDPSMVSLLGIDYVKSRLTSEPSPHLSLNYDYYAAVPSRWQGCHNLQSYIMSGQKWFIPAYPIVDEEYVELVSIYQLAMKAKLSFTLVEIGARWGPWGYRAAAAIRRYNPDVQNVDLLFFEPEKESCDAIRKVAEVNEFKLPKFNVSVVCETFGSSGTNAGENGDDKAFRSWAATRSVIDVFDMDCQGCEYDMIPKIKDILNSKVRRVIIGVHEPGMAGVTSLLNVLEGWVHVHVTPMGKGGWVDGWGSESDCPAILKTRSWKWQAQSELSECSKSPHFDLGYKYGPMINHDGDIILDNPRFGTNPVLSRTTPERSVALHRWRATRQHQRAYIPEKT